MTQYDFDAVIDRRGTDCEKWSAYDDDVLPLWVADMDFRSPEPVIRALQARIEHGIFGYPCDEKFQPLRSLLVDRMADLYGWRIQPEDILFIPGVVKGFHLACYALADPGKAVVVQTPVYPPILEASQVTGLQHQENELIRHPDGSYTVDFEAFAKSLTPATKLFILCNPHNPVGKAFQPAELERLAEICLRHAVFICSDEIHCDLVYSDYRHTPIASLDPEIAQNTITLIAPSKTYNLAGLQCSAAIIPNPELRQRYLAARKGLVSWVNVLGLVAAQAAYQEGQEWLDQLLTYLEGNRNFVHQYVQDRLPGIKMGLPEATYLAWLDCREAGIPINPSQYFLKYARVALNDGATFGKAGEGFVRLNFGCPRTILVDALERMRVSLIQRPSSL